MESNSRTTGDMEWLGRKSWLAFKGPIFLFCFAGFLIPTALKIFHQEQMWVAIGAVMVFVAWLLWIKSLHSIRVGINSSGVWVASGFLPWTKGLYGLKWRDMDKAVYQPSLMSWLFNTYTIRMIHRFNTDNNYQLYHMKKGDVMVQKINDRLDAVRSE